MGKNRYDPAQWEFMNRPETQEKIRQSLKGYIRSFLDTAPDGRTQDRYLEILSLLKTYFKKELEESATDHTEFVLANLSSAIRMLPTYDRVAAIMNTEASERAETTEEWERFEKFLERQGLDGWWD